MAGGETLGATPLGTLLGMEVPNSPGGRGHLQQAKQTRLYLCSEPARVRTGVKAARATSTPGEGDTARFGWGAADTKSEALPGSGWTCSLKSGSPGSVAAETDCVRVGGGYLQLLPGGVSAQKPRGPGTGPPASGRHCPLHCGRPCCLSRRSPVPATGPCLLHGEGCGCEVWICGSCSTEGTGLRMRRT